jgi:hypothetical protein
MTFQEVIIECALDKRFVKVFNRLTNSTLMVKSTHPIIQMIDEATGYDKVKEDENWTKFVNFVYEVVWTRVDLRSE